MRALRRTLALPFLVMSLVLAAAGCGGGGANDEATDAKGRLAPLDPPADFTFGLLPVQSPVFIAIKRGYFKQVGLNVKVKFLQSGSQVLPALASGDIDAATSSPAAGLFNAAARGVPVNIVADAGSYVKGHSVGAFVVRKDLIDSGKVRTLKDLKGMRLAATAKGTAMDMFNYILLDKAGLKPGDVRLEYLGFPDMMAALASKKIDAGQLTEPFITNGEKKGFLKRWIPHTDLEPNGQQTVLMFAPRLIKKDEGVGKRFMEAYLRGCRDYNAAMGKSASGRDEIVGIMSEYLRQDKQLIKDSVSTYFEPNGRVNQQSIAFRQQFWADRDLIKKPVKIEDVIDTRFSDYAVAQLGKS